jgi:allantoinase
MDERLSILTNVLVSAGGNSLRLVDVHFDDAIRRIVPKRNPPLEWMEIASREDWQRFASQLPAQPQQSAGRIIDGGYLLLIPGSVDAHVHFDTPGYEDREDFEHGSLAAVCGGVTTVADMPCTSVPPVTSRANLETKLAALRERSSVDYALWGGVSAQMLSDPNARENIHALAEADVAGFKCYMTSGMDSFADLGPAELVEAARLVKEVGLPLAVHAEERTLVRRREQALRNAGRKDWRAYAEARDAQAESAAVAILRDVARATGCAIHIVHLTSAAGLEIVAAAQAEGLPLSAETCPHYLHFTESDFDRPEISAFLKTAPPVKSETDRAALWQGLQGGALSFVTTDHAGCDPASEKSSADFWEIYGGIPGVEHRVPYLFSEGFKRGRLSLERTVELLATAPARFLGLAARKGSLERGKDADFALMDLWSEQRVSSDRMHSKGQYTPFEGVVFGAAVKKTWLRGTLVADSADPDFASVRNGWWIRRGGALA